MQLPPPNPGSGALSGIARKGVFLLEVLPFGFLFPALVALGGSTNLLNWGPGLLLAGLCCLLLVGKSCHTARGGVAHSICFLLFLGFLLIRTRQSPDVSASANNSALIVLAAAGFLIGKRAGAGKSRALFTGLSLVAIGNLACTVMQMATPDWNLIYPQRTGMFPSGFFAHYSYSSAFCLATAGLLFSRGVNDSTWLKSVFLAGAACAVVAIPLSLSRGGNLALAFLAAIAIALLLARAFSTAKSLLSSWLPVFVLPALVLIFGSAFVPLIARNTGSDAFYADSVRFDFWKAAVQISTEHPWLGGGAGSFAWQVFHVLDGLSAEPGKTHNEALQVAVEYGYPALMILAFLIAIPVVLCFWRYVNRTGTATTPWAAVGLMAMLLQSNFENIFHTAPAAFITALILGRISRDLWSAESDDIPKEVGRGNDRIRPDRRFLLDVGSHVGDHLAGRADAISKLIGLLSQSKDETWKRSALRLTYWSKVGNDNALRDAVTKLGATASAELARLAGNPPDAAQPTTTLTRGLRAAGNLALAGCAIPVVIAGTEISQALVQAWVPMYHPERLTTFKRFTQLLSLVERHPGMGIDRQVLTAGLNALYHYKSQEAREHWAFTYRPRLLRAVPGWRTDPGVALQLADISGWAGDAESALNFYNHAIAAQGANESLFLARSFKGQYLYELCVSAAAEGKLDQLNFYAREAVASFKDADAAMGVNHGTLSPFFMKMLRQCQNFQKQDT
ncbi:MAG: O-antigen ligase family protein [Verrucomicrobiota bacterium]